MPPKDKTREDGGNKKKRKGTPSFFADGNDTTGHTARQNSSRQDGCPYDQLPEVIRETALQKANAQQGHKFEARRIAKVLADRSEREDGAKQQSPSK